MQATGQAGANCQHQRDFDQRAAFVLEYRAKRERQADRDTDA